MISPIKNLPATIIGFRCKGKVIAKDYESVLYPVFEKARKKSKKLKVKGDVTQFKGKPQIIIKGLSQIEIVDK